MLQSTQIKTQAEAIGFHKVGIAKIESNQNSDRSVNSLQNWLAKGYHADMAWMEDTKRQNVLSLMPEARSIICVALNYYTPHQHSNHPEDGKISRYGWGRDYHKVMGQKLKTLSNWLQEQETAIITRYYVDTAPIQDKFWAQQAGIGWIAKNGNVISREYGSWLFLGEILTNWELEADRPHTAHCGTCTRCLEACPTQAIAEPFVVDANRCIAYHTIENRHNELPPEIATNLSGWVAGCDICQDVCPWNQRFAQETDIADFQPYPHNIQPKLQDLAEIEETTWDRHFRASALRRIKPKMLRRNARANLISRGIKT
jgi:epoxyqueuosine reductase